MKKKIVALCTLVVLALLLVATPALAGSGLAVYSPYTIPANPATMVWKYGYPMTHIVQSGTYEFNFGRGLSYCVGTTGDEIAQTVSVKILLPSSYAIGYEPMPLQYVKFDLDSWQAKPSNGYKADWLRFYLPDSPEYYGKKYQFQVEFSLAPAGGTVGIGCAVKGNIYICTPTK